MVVPGHVINPARNNNLIGINKFRFIVKYIYELIVYFLYTGMFTATKKRGGGASQYRVSE